MRQLFFISYFFLSLYSRLQAQDSTIFFDHYATADGLSNKEVTDIAQDEDGFIWIATRGGLNRFDGKDFVKYYSTGSQNNLPSNDIIRIECLALHRLVVGTASGIGILDTHTGITRQLIIPSVDELKIYTNRITDLVVDSSNNIIVTTYTGIYVFDQSFKLTYRHDAYSLDDVTKKRIVFAYTLYLLQNKNVLVPGLNNFFVLDIKKRKLEGIDDLKGDQWEFLKQWEKKPFLLLKWNPHRQGFLVDYDAHTANLRLNLVDLLKQKNISLPLPSPPGLINELSWKSRLFFLNDSMFAINSSHQNGLYLFHLNSQKPSVKYEGKLLSDIQCNWSFADQKGRLWVGTDEGIFKQSFSKNAFHNFSTPAIGKVRNIDNFVSGFAHVHNILFVSIHSQGVLMYDENGNFLRRIGFENFVKLNLPWSISPYNRDTLLIPTQIGALLLHSGNYGLRKFWQPGMPAVIDSLAITANLIDSHHQLWMGMGSGFGVFMFNMDTRKWKLFSPTVGQNAFPLRYPKSINEDKWGNIWMSGTEGITRWNWQKKIFDTLVRKMAGLPGDITGQWNYTTTDKKGNIWICPEDFVLAKWNLQTNKINIFKRPENIAPCKASQINGPWNNRLWIKTNIGLVSFNVITEKFNLLKKDDGLPDENVSDGGLYYDSVSLRLYAGFNNAFTWFYPNEVLQQKQPTITYITDIRKIGDTVSYAGNTNLNFLHNNNSISISYTSINFDKGESNTYAYRLFEGKPSGWINVADQKTLSFANLKPGAYTFQVKTILSDGTESLQPASIELTISPAYYQTWWFYMLCIIIVTAGIYALYRYRINQLLHLHKMRDAISSDLHDDIGARLTNINILTMLSEQNVNHPETISSYLKRIAKEIQSSGQALDDIVWSINSHNDLLPEIVARMRRYAADIFEATNISFQFNSDKQLSNHSMSMGQRRDLFLVYKEAISNIQKHAQATIVDISLKGEKKSLCLTVADNGKGFDVSQPTDRNGLKNMCNRIEKWKGSFSITSSSETGTTITILLPDNILTGKGDFRR